MNGMHDKRTSISQLLNPSSDSSSAYPHPTHIPTLSPSTGVSQYQHTQHPQHPPYPHQPESGSFHLRAASWEPANDDPTAPKRRPDPGPPTGRSYPMPPHLYTEMNGDVSQRQPRQRIDEHGNFTMPPGPWPPQPDVPTVPYGSPIVAPMYSDERTAMSGDYAQNNQYTHAQPEHHQQSMHPHHACNSPRFSAQMQGQPMFEVGALMHPTAVFSMLYQHPPPPPPLW